MLVARAGMCLFKNERQHVQSRVVTLNDCSNGQIYTDWPLQRPIQRSRFVNRLS